MFSHAATQQTEVTKISQGKPQAFQDQLATEAPLEIRLAYDGNSGRVEQSISVTMRTPGADSDLSTGFLFTEGILSTAEQLLSVSPENRTFGDPNQILLELIPGYVPNLSKLDRNFLSSASCGVCGKSSKDQLMVLERPTHYSSPQLHISSEIIHQLPATLRQAQEVFGATGGMHAAGLFDLEGNLLLVREDVGRHNALDKLIGAALVRHWLPLDNHIICLSGRVGFELVQKSLMAGCHVLAAVGAPSSLSVNLAHDYDLTLLGFVREHKFNMYSGPQRILLQE